MSKRQVEIFTAGCPVCEPVVQLVAELACPDCEVTVHDVRDDDAARARAHGVTSLPSVVVDGRVSSCCTDRGPNLADLTLAGIGIPRT